MSELSRADSATSFKQNRWTSDLIQSGVQEWFPPEGKAAGVEHYFSTAASLIESGCSGQGFHFHFTANTNTVPLSGPKSIVFVMSEENGLLPRYTRSVEAVFKCYGAKFVSTAEWFWNHPALLVSSLAKDAIVFKRILVTRWRWRHDQVRRGEAFASAIVHHIPLGYHSLPPTELPAWEARVNDVFFAGSIRQHVGKRKGIKIPNPKEIVRDDLAESLKRFEARKKWNLRLLLATGFVPHAVAWGLAAKGSTMSPDAYMQEMANSKICLAPRGTSFETFRHYEAASAGCVVVSDRLPRTWFYQNAPFVFVRDWRKVDQILDRLLQDPAKLQALHEETLSWWKTRLSPDALAEYVLYVLRRPAPEGSSVTAR
jgi:Glycosyl transferases group 1